MKTSVDDLGKEVANALDGYKKVTNEKLKKAVRSSAQIVKDEIKNTAPRKSGTYAKSWNIKKMAESENLLTLVVYAKRYQIAHLLEHGHAKRGGGRVTAFPHIKKAEELGIKEFEKQLTEELNG